MKANPSPQNGQMPVMPSTGDRRRGWYLASMLLAAVVGALILTFLVVRSSIRVTALPQSIAAGTVPQLVVDDMSAGQPISPALWGSNLPSWLAPAGITDPALQDLAVQAGLAVMRMPGGSWSNGYDWRACEVEHTDGCWGWAGRPRDYIAFLQATGMEGMYTVNPNGTSQEAAALVAFFNGAIDDERSIGVDVRGHDWGTVSDWAKLRADGGSPEPLYVKYWEIGNEVYGGTQGSGTDCQPWGWEEVWTCDGTEYVLGIGSGADRREGYLEFRAAMQAIDPSIFVGAVGVPIQAEWNNWGNEVIAAAGAVMDFYVVHHYGFFEQPASYAAALAAPQAEWPRIMADIRAAFAEHAGGRSVPVAVTEFNLFSVQEQDNDRWMTRMVNALYMADTLGQMASQGVTLANQWDFANGRAANGTNYGMIDSDTQQPYPQFFAYLLWSRFGKELLPVTSPFSAESEMSVYAGREDDLHMTVLVVNKTDTEQAATLAMTSGRRFTAAKADVLTAASLGAEEITFNGRLSTAANILSTPSMTLENPSTPLFHRFPAHSITLLQLSLDTSDATPEPRWRILLPIAK